MPKRLIKKGITVIRDGNRVRPTVGKVFDLTKEEIAALDEADASALGKASEAEDAEGDTAAPPSAQQSQSKASGGKKKATAGKSDAENAADGDEGEPPAGEGGGPGAGTDDDL
jgi:hypothetical protein